MIPDDETNTVIISNKLQVNFNRFTNELTEILLNAGILITELRNTADIWCRDYLPVQINGEKFVQFIYKPTYLENHLQLLTDPELLKLPFRRTYSNLILEGGNIVHWKNKVILTEKVFSDNADKSHADVKNMLAGQLAVEEIIIIPRPPFDTFGHADAIVRFIDDHTVLMSNYSNKYKHYLDHLTSLLKRNHINIVKFPCFEPEEQNIFGRCNANGSYINYLHAGETVIIPVFDHDCDEIAYKVLSTFFPAHNLYTIKANDIASHGGVLNGICYNFRS